MRSPFATARAISPFGRASVLAVAASTYAFDMALPDYVTVISDLDTSVFTNNFNSGFCLYTKAKLANVVDDMAMFCARINGGLSLNFNAGIIRLSNWIAFAVGSTTFSANDIVSIFVRHSSGTTKIWASANGGAANLEYNAARTYTGTQSLRVTWGGRQSFSEVVDAQLKDDLYDGAVWLSDAVSEADGLELVNGTKTISQIASTPTSWFDAETKRDRSGTVVHRNNWGVRPASMIFDGADVPADNPDDFVVMRNPETFAPVTYDAGSGAVYWAAYDNSNRTPSPTEKSLRLATSADLTNWTDASIEIKASIAGQAVSDFVYMGAEAGGHNPFWLFYSTGGQSEAVINLATSANMSAWTDDAANPVFTNEAGPGNGIEDFRIAKIAANYWMAIYEQDDMQADDDLAIGAALSTSAVPSGAAWTNQTDNILGTIDGGFAASGFFANPCLLRDGSTLWMFYEGWTDHGPPFTMARRCDFTAPSDVFTPGNYTHYGVVAWRYNWKYFPNCATNESGTIQIYLQSGDGPGSAATDGITKIPFLRSLVTEFS